jgi:hypothetical protein
MAGTDKKRGREGLIVPTLFRFLVIVGVLAALGYGAMWALVLYVEPQPREISVTIPPTKLGK